MVTCIIFDTHSPLRVKKLIFSQRPYETYMSVWGRYNEEPYELRISV